MIAHELSHIKHYDMLVGTITATISGAIAMLANFGMFFGGNDETAIFSTHPTTQQRVERLEMLKD